VAALYGAPLLAGLLGAAAGYGLAAGWSGPLAQDGVTLAAGLCSALVCLLWLRRRLPARVSSLAMRLVAGPDQPAGASELDSQAVSHH
jgi:hypothetical protein